MTYASSTPVPPSCLVGLDISATFVTVNHNILLCRLEQDFGIIGHQLQWSASCVSSRSFCVHLGTSPSLCAVTSTGMPRGSVLDPLLLTSCVALFVCLIESYGIKYHKYADDTHLYAFLAVPPDSSITAWRTAPLNYSTGSGVTNCCSIQTSLMHASSAPATTTFQPAGVGQRLWYLHRGVRETEDSRCSIRQFTNFRRLHQWGDTCMPVSITYRHCVTYSDH